MFTGNTSAYNPDIDSILNPAGPPKSYNPNALSELPSWGLAGGKPPGVSYSPPGYKDDDDEHEEEAPRAFPVVHSAPKREEPSRAFPSQYYCQNPASTIERAPLQSV